MTGIRRVVTVRFGLAVLLAVAACAHASRTGTAADEMDVHAAVLRQIIEQTDRAEGRVPCLAWSDPDQADPAPEQLAALRAVVPGLVAGSECGLASPTGGMIHRPSGRPAILYTLSAVTWTSRNSGVVVGGYGMASLDGMWCTYRVRRESAGWVVERDERSCAVS